MDSLTDVLGRHHRECDALLAAADNAVSCGDWSLAGTCFDAFRGDLQAHFDAEESVLFPRFEVATGMIDGPTHVMRGEHAAMRDALIRIADALARQDADDFGGESETLFVLMQQHNMKEESVLYPMCDRRFADEAATLKARIEQLIEEVGG